MQLVLNSTATRSDAEHLLVWAKDKIRRNGKVLVSELFEEWDFDRSYYDRTRCWTDLSKAYVLFTDGRYVIDLPDPVHIESISDLLSYDICMSTVLQNSVSKLHGIDALLIGNIITSACDWQNRRDAEGLKDIIKQTQNLLEIIEKENE